MSDPDEEHVISIAKAILEADENALDQSRKRHPFEG